MGGSGLAQAVVQVPQHGIGGPQDLPIPASLTIAGAGVAVLISFLVLALAWREPRYDRGTFGVPLPRLTRRAASPWMRGLGRALGLFLLAWVSLAAVLGKDSLVNPAFGMFYVWWWVGMVALSVLVGPVWRAISPVRSINTAFARIAGTDPDRGLVAYPAWLGYWPAALGLYAFVWLELVSENAASLAAVRLWGAVYLAAMLLGGAVFGSVFFERADPFEVYSTLAGRMSVWGRRPALDADDPAPEAEAGSHQGEAVAVVQAVERPAPRERGEVLLLSPLANLATITARPGLTAVVAVLFGSTAYDAFHGSTRWIEFVQTNGFMVAHSWSLTLVANLVLLTFVAGVGLLFAGAVMLTGVTGHVRRRHLPDLLAHAVVPIVVAYVVAHYLTYLVQLGQDTLIKMSDPLGTGANYLGTGDWSVNYWLSYQPTLIAVIKVVAVVSGHVLGVVASHDRALHLLPREHRIAGQVPLLVVMVAFTVGGLYLLFAA